MVKKLEVAGVAVFLVVIGVVVSLGKNTLQQIQKGQYDGTTPARFIKRELPADTGGEEWQPIPKHERLRKLERKEAETASPPRTQRLRPQPDSRFE